MKKHHDKNSRTIPLFVLFIPLFYSFLTQTGPDFEERTKAFFIRENKIRMQKLYLHFDKPYYSSGEKMWFRGYLVDAGTHWPDTTDRFIYVELIDPTGEIKIRKKIKWNDSIGFAGSLSIPPDLPSSRYLVRGYTAWMRNFDDDHFFLRSFDIQNGLQPQIQSDMTYRTEKKRTAATVRFFNDKNRPYAKTKIKYLINDSTGKKRIEAIQATDDSGRIEIVLPPSITADRNPFLEVAFVESDYHYQRRIPIRLPQYDYAVTFLPEGGNLLADVQQTVAFKAQNSDGRGEQISGYIYAENGDTVARIETVRDGMGKFGFKPEPGVRYRARIRSKQGTEKTVDLPETVEQGLSLSVSSRSEQARYNVLCNDPSLWSDSLFIIVHTRGLLTYIRPVDPEHPFGVLDTESLPEGISHIVLMKKDGTPLSERLFFVRKDKSDFRWQIETDKPTDNKREKIALSIALLDDDGKPVKGDFSLSITDRKTVIPDSTADNIVSNLLLTSDLKGYIDRPAELFRENNDSNRMLLDLVMLTHGWCRFRIDSLTERPKQTFRYFKERGQVVAGKAEYGLRKKKPAGGSVSMTLPQQQLFAETKIREDGSFLLEGIDYRDSVILCLQGRNRKGGSGNIVLHPEFETVPPVRLNRAFRNDTTSIPKQYLADMREQYFAAGGSKLIYLKEISISADPGGEKESGFLGPYDKVYTGNELAKDKNTHTLMHALGRISGAYQFPIFRGSTDSDTIIFVDGFEMLPEFYFSFESIPIEAVAKIEVIRGYNTHFVPIFKNRPLKRPKVCIFIFLKNSYWTQGEASLGFAPFPSLGYSSYTDFYAPVYDTPQQQSSEQDDFRSTIYWTPRIQPDTFNRMWVEFYTSDRPGNYWITIEGITENGDIYRHEENLK